MKYSSQDPIWGVAITWSPRRESSVTIKNRLWIWNNTRKCDDPVPVTFVVPKALLEWLLPVRQETSEALLPLAIWCALAIWKEVVGGAHTRKPTLSLLVRPDSAVRLSFERQYLATFKRLFAGLLPPAWSDSPNETEEFTRRVQNIPSAWEVALAIHPSPPWLHLCYLTLDIAKWLLCSRTLRWVVHPPRGAAAAVAYQTSLIPAALFACQKLAQQALADDEEGRQLKALIASVLKEDAEAYAYCQRFGCTPQPLAVALAHRQFREEFKKVGHPGLLGENPRSIFRRYVYNKGQNKELAQTIDDYARSNPAVRPYLLRVWREMYLTPRNLAV